MELSNKGKKDADILFGKAETVQQQVDELKNEAFIHKAQAEKYARQVR